MGDKQEMWSKVGSLVAAAVEDEELRRRLKSSEERARAMEEYGLQLADRDAIVGDLNTLLFESHEDVNKLVFW